MKKTREALRGSPGGAPWAKTAAAALLFALVLLSAPMAAPAVEIAGTSSTYLQARETADGSKLFPLYEYLNFSVQDLGRESISFSFGGYMRYDLGEEILGKDRNSDLQYAYLSYRRRSANAVVNLGRVMVFEGVAAERVDGMYARTDLRAGFGVSAFGGSPVMTNDGDDLGANSIYGARLSHRIDNRSTIGVSYLKQEKNSLDFREEQGADLWIRPIDKVQLMGRSAYNERMSGWMQHAYTLLFGPFGKLSVNAEASRTNYEFYFDGGTNSAFTFTPGGPVDPKEKLDILGAAVSYALTDRMTLSIDHKQYDYALAGGADSFGAGLRYSLTGSTAAGGSVRRMDGDADRLSYYEYRVYGFKKYGRLDVTVDVMEVAYDADINGESNALSTSLAAGYDLDEKLRLGADLQYAQNPDFDREARVFMKLIYRFDTSSGKGKGV